MVQRRAHVVNQTKEDSTDASFQGLADVCLCDTAESNNRVEVRIGEDP